jgi:hypothetical protein
MGVRLYLAFAFTFTFLSHGVCKYEDLRTLSHIVSNSTDDDVFLRLFTLQTLSYFTFVFHKMTHSSDRTGLPYYRIWLTNSHKNYFYYLG